MAWNLLKWVCHNFFSDKGLKLWPIVTKTGLSQFPQKNCAKQFQIVTNLCFLSQNETIWAAWLVPGIPATIVNLSVLQFYLAQSVKNVVDPLPHLPGALPVLPQVQQEVQQSCQQQEKSLEAQPEGLESCKDKKHTTFRSNLDLHSRSWQGWPSERMPATMRTRPMRAPKTTEIHGNNPVRDSILKALWYTSFQSVVEHSSTIRSIPSVSFLRACSVEFPRR